MTSGGKEFVASVSYEAHGGVKEVRKNGGLLKETYSYNAGRLQLTGIVARYCEGGVAACSTGNDLLTLGLDFQTTATGGNGGGPNNNGNGYAQRISVPSGFDVKQSYGYDAWSRLETFQEAPGSGGAAALSEKYCYDAGGNPNTLRDFPPVTRTAPTGGRRAGTGMPTEESER